MYLMISLAISLPVADSIPSNPGEELTSKIKGPLLDWSISTPATPSPIALVAFNAARSSSSDNSMISAEPPRCNYARNSPS